MVERLNYKHAKHFNFSYLWYFAMGSVVFMFLKYFNQSKADQIRKELPTLDLWYYLRNIKHFSALIYSYIIGGPIQCVVSYRDQ